MIPNRCPHPLCDDPECQYARAKASIGDRVWMAIAIGLVVAFVLFLVWFVFVTQVVPQ